MAALTVQQAVATNAALTPAFTAAAAGGDTFANSGKAFLYIKNADATPTNVTINSQTTCNQGFDHDIVVAVTNAQERMVGPFPKNRFDNASGLVEVAYSKVTSLTVAVIEVP